MDPQTQEQAFTVLTQDMLGDYPFGNVTLEQFFAATQAMTAPRVLELGTLRTGPESPNHRHDWVPNAGEYLGSDIRSGPGVDIVADAHRLSDVTGSEAFDVILACATLEHIKYPHKAAHEMMKALKIGGVLFVQTNQTFPIHFFPYDYFRFSKEALSGLFGTKMGFSVLATDYQFPVKILSTRDAYLQHLEAYMNVCLFGRKLSPTPQSFIYEYDVETGEENLGSGDIS